MNQNHQFQPHGFLSPANFNNNQSDEVNWAQLAQRWIYANQNQQQQQGYPPPIQMGAVGYTPSQQLPFRLPQNYQQQPMQIAQPNVQPLFSNAGHIHQGYFPPPSSYPQKVHHLPDQWGSRPWPPPASNMVYSHQQYPPRVIAPRASLPLIQYPLAQSSTGAKQQEEEEYQAHYDPSLADDPAETDQPEQEVDPNAPPEGAMCHWMNMWGSTSSYPNNYVPVIDMQMRKKLPSWILEGLEKAEKEKQKKLEKDEAEQQQNKLEEEKRRKREEKGLGKFDSDSEDEDDDNEQNDKETTKAGSPIRHFREFFDDKKKVGEKDQRTSEERRQEAVLLMRRLITSVLLNVTNREFERIAEESIVNVKNSKAQPKILAKSSALAMLSSFADEDEEDETSSNDGTDLPKSAKVNASPAVHDEKKEAKDSQLVFKVPLAPLLKSAKPDQQEVTNAKGVKKDENKQGNLHSTNQEQTNEKQSERHTKAIDEHRLKEDDHNLPARYRSSNGKDKDRKRYRDRKRECGRSRSREEREQNRHYDRRRDDRHKNDDREKDKARRQSRSRSRSPRRRENRSRTYRDRSHSPRR